MAQDPGCARLTPFEPTYDTELCREIAAFRPRLERFARSLARDDSMVDDLVQMALERALRRRRHWQPGTRLDSWLCRILHNAWRDEHRQRRVRGEMLPVESIASTTDGEAVPYHRLLLGEVRTAMEALPPCQKAVLHHVAVEGLTYREAADAMRTSIGTVMSRLHRARQRIGAAMG